MKKILNYILYIKSFDLNCSGKSSLQSHLMEMSEYFNLPDFITDLLDIAIVKNIVGWMKQEYTIGSRINTDHFPKRATKG